MTIHDWPDVLPGTAAVRYANLILDRVADGMPNDDWAVDWANAPLTVADHRGATVRLMDVPEPARNDEKSGRVALSRTITDVCFSAYGVTGPRLNVNLNDRPEVHARVANVKWGRGTASGGGRYGIDLYLVHGGDDELDAGVYHFSVIANGWEQLHRHDRTHDVRTIQHHDFLARAYLVVTINFWRSAFKYSDFAYQATAMDVGTFFGAQWETLGDAVSGTWDMEVDEAALAELLGLDPLDQGVYAVQAWGTVPDADERPRPMPRTTPVAAFRRNRSVVRFPTAVALQQDMSRERPDLSTRANVEAVPSTATVAYAGRRRLLARETSFGRFSGEAISAASLDQVLARSRSAARAMTAAAPYAPPLSFLVYVNRVDGLEPGLYIDDESGMRRIAAGDQSRFLESTYFLHNYMGRRAACTVIVCAAVIEAARERGVRGYRSTNAIVGAACQALLTGANDIGVATGTALGFDAAAHARHASVDPAAIAPMLMIMLGVDASASGRVHARATVEVAS